MNTAQIKLYDILRNDLSLNDEKALRFVEVIDSVIIDEVKLGNNEFKSLIKEDLLLMEIRVKDKISDQFKWVIGVFITLALMIVGLYLKK